MTTIGPNNPNNLLPTTRPLVQVVGRPMFRSLAIASTGLSAQRARMEVAAQNIANAETTRTPEGGPYRRKVVSLKANLGTPQAMQVLDISALAGLAGGGAPLSVLSSIPVPIAGGAEAADAGGVRIAGIAEDTTEGPLVYDPGHPDANANGYVRLPNVRITDEMMEMMDARRIYDANATVFQSAKAMLRRAIDI
jgi:flagellar basal-body rod protein FlgC